jgi:superfamily II DNA or RNA helicase
MLWLTRRKARIIETHREAAQHVALPAGIAIAAHAESVLGSSCELASGPLPPITTHICDSMSVGVTIAATSARMAVASPVATSHESCTSFSDASRIFVASFLLDAAVPAEVVLTWPAATRERGDLGLGGNLVAPSFSTFQTVISRFDFAEQRHEPRALFSQRPQRTSVRVEPVTPLPSPARPPTESLQDKLRWILTPPIHELLSDPQLTLPETPFPYQTQGIKWLYDRHSALLADEMGLGKTMQAILAARLLWRERLIKQILVVCPKTLVSNWRAEIRLWWPQVANNIVIAAAGDRHWFLRLATDNVVVKIINYESLLREVEWLESTPVHHELVIIDEAQRIKNPKTDTARSVKALRSDRRWALTGTPLEDKIEDVISIFGFVRPEMPLAHDPKQIAYSIQPHMLRRRTDEVLPQLPEKIEQDIEVELTDRQREVYDYVEREGVLELNGKGDTITVTHVFALITKLRQICSFEPESGDSAKADRLLEDLEEIDANERKALIFCQFVSEEFGLRRLARVLQEHHYATLQLHGSVPQNQVPGILDRFKSDSACRALLLNYKVGGVGLNLQAANYVFLFDRWWNPAVEDQAVKRAHRLGQVDKVFVRKFYCKDTIEERMLRKLAEKRRLFRYVIDECRPAESMGLTEEEIFSLFNLTVRPRRISAQPQVHVLVLDNLDPTQFEALVADLYQTQSYEVRLTGGSHDGGVDVFAERRTDTGSERVAIQCKHQSNNVGRPVLQQLWGVVSDDPSITAGVLVTSSSFTSEAREFAHGKRITLVDRAALTRLCRDLRVADFAPPMPAIER